VGHWNTESVVWADTLERGQIVRRLDLLAERRVPPVAAGVAARWTERTGDFLGRAVPDALIDVWIALDDWVQAGSPEADAGGLGGRLYVRLVHALTAFDTYLRYGR
jgi:hypothetical protein